MATSFLERAQRECPYVFQSGYSVDDASGLMRRERFIHCLQYGHSLLSAAVHNVPQSALVSSVEVRDRIVMRQPATPQEGMSTADLIGIEDSESMETEQGQNLCPSIACC